VSAPRARCRRRRTLPGESRVLSTAPSGVSTTTRLPLLQRARHHRHARHIVTFRSGGNHASVDDGAASRGRRLSVGHRSARLRFERRRGCATLALAAEVGWCASRKQCHGAAGRGPAWLRRLTGGQEIGSSNLPVPTDELAAQPKGGSARAALYSVSYQARVTNGAEGCGPGLTITPRRPTVADAQQRATYVPRQRENCGHEQSLKGDTNGL
jgi:hypothetical protein